MSAMYDSVETLVGYSGHHVVGKNKAIGEDHPTKSGSTKEECKSLHGKQSDPHSRYDQLPVAAATPSSIIAEDKIATNASVDQETDSPRQRVSDEAPVLLIAGTRRDTISGEMGLASTREDRKEDGEKVDLRQDQLSKTRNEAYVNKPMYDSVAVCMGYASSLIAPTKTKLPPIAIEASGLSEMETICQPAPMSSSASQCRDLVEKTMDGHLQDSETQQSVSTGEGNNIEGEELVVRNILTSQQAVEEREERASSEGNSENMVLVSSDSKQLSNTFQTEELASDSSRNACTVSTTTEEQEVNALLFGYPSELSATDQGEDDLVERVTPTPVLESESLVRELFPELNEDDSLVVSDCNVTAPIITVTTVDYKHPIEKELPMMSQEEQDETQAEEKNTEFPATATTVYEEPNDDILGSDTRTCPSASPPATAPQDQTTSEIQQQKDATVSAGGADSHSDKTLKTQQAATGCTSNAAFEIGSADCSSCNVL
jgi:hypothetical protein